MSIFKFTEFKPFASFLLENRLDEATRLVLASAKNANLPLLSKLSHLSDDALFSLSKQSIKDFLEAALDDQAMQAAMLSVANWKNNVSPLVSKNQVELSDIVLVYNIRKRSLISQLAHYTADINLVLGIVEELEAFYSQVEQYAFQTYVDIQQEELKKEKDFISSLIDHSVNGVLGFDQELRITYYNTVLERWNRNKKTDVLGKKVFDVFPSYAQNEEGKALYKVLQGEQVKISEKQFEGNEAFYEIDMIPLSDGESQVRGGFSIIRDISSHKKTEQKLRDQQEELRAVNETLREEIAQRELIENELRLSRDYYLTILDDFPALIWRSDKEGKCDYFNKTWFDFTGRSLSQESGDGWTEGVHRDDIDNCMAIFLTAFKARQPFQMEYRLRHIDGTYRHLVDYAKPLYDPKGNFTGYIGVCFDIEDQKQAHKKLRDSNHFIERVTYANPSVIFVVDLTNMQLLYSNRDVLELLGFSKAEIAGRKLSSNNELIHPEDMAKRNAYFASLPAIEDNEVKEVEYRVQDASGNYHTFLTRSVIFERNEKGEATQVMGISIDVTARAVMEAQVQQKNHDLSEAYQELAAIQEELQQSNEELNQINIELEKRVEERTAKLEEQRATLHNLFMQVPALIGILRGREGRIELFNPAFSKLWGNRQVIGKSMREILPELKDQGYFELIEQVFDTGNSVTRTEFPSYIDRQNNGTLSLAYFDLIYAPYFDLDGKIDGVIIYGVEVTEHVLSRKALKDANEELYEKNQEIAASEEELKGMLEKTVELNHELESRENFLSSIIDQTPVSTWIADATGTQIRVNKACLDLFGVEDASAGIGRYNILKDETLLNQTFYKDIEAVFTEGKTIRVVGDYDLSKVKHINVPTGKAISLIMTIFPVKDTNGKVTHAVVQHEDITERIRAEQALKASEEQLRLITDALPVLISYVDKDERYRFNNKAYEEWFGISSAQLYGKKVKEVLGDGAYEKTREKIERALSGETLYVEQEMDYKDAGKRYVSVNFIPHRKQQQEVLGYYALITDITHRRVTEQALQQALEQMRDKNEQLIRINTDLDNFIYTASHDLRSPIATMEGLVMLLNRRISSKLTPAENEYLALMSDAVTKLKRTIGDLTEIVKVQKDLETAVEEVSFQDILEEVKADIKEMIQEADATITTDFQVATIPYARKNLRSIIYNLLSNAIKYRSPSRPLQIAVQTRQENEHIILTVKDNGLGIRKELQSKLFNMFKRLHTHVEGTGIGLYIVKRIIENNRGRIEVESEEDKGSTFKVYFKSDNPQ